MRVIPEGLKLGVATSNFQIEGAWNVSDKSPSMWDTYCHIPGKIRGGTNADDACKSYEYYQRDIQMMKYLGVDFYRFSIAWTRVLPNGFANVISKDGINYYNRLIDELIANGIEPMVTIFHWDLPQNLQDLGGWANPLIVQWFEDYARVLFDAFGDRVKTWITINEPKQFAIFGYGTQRFAPDIVSTGIGDYMAAKNALLAHARAFHLYDKEYRGKQKGICGITIATDFREGATNSPSDINIGKLAMDFEVGLYSHPIFSTTGGFPEDVVKRVAEKSAQQGFPRSRLPELTPEEVEYIKGTSDFYGFNHYSTKFYTEDGYTPGKFPIPSAVLKLFALVLAVSSVTLWDLSKGDITEMRVIPEGLKLGVATSNFQIEGAWNVSDKSPSMWDTYCHIPGKIRGGTNADDACKSYEYYQRDIQMMKYLGVDFYRFSIAWTRVLPNGFANVISKDGINYYNRLIDELIANGIEPMVTIFHWDLPQNLQDLGGWANPLIVQWFEDYARVLFDAFGDRVKTWITINEPKQFAIYGYGTQRFAPDIVSAGIGDYMAAKNALLAHARAFHLYDKEYRGKQKGICGITIATDFREGATNSPSDINIGKLAMDFEVGLYSHPIFSTTGGFPEDVVKRVAEKSAQQGFPRSRLPELTPEEVEYIKGTSDFYGFNHYSTKFYTEDGYTPGKFPIPSYDDDIGAITSYLDYKPAPVLHSTPIPNGIRTALNWVRKTYNNPPIMITENGYGDLGGSDDKDRVKYYMDYIDAVLDAIEDGCNVTTYTAWSLMDNFEWDTGLESKFGLFEVDFDDDKRTRKAKRSAIWYRHLLSTRTLDRHYEPELKEITF